MIHPLIPFAIKGAIWYQGEANASRAWQYRSLFPDLISTWRQTFAAAMQNPALATMPFCAVQLAPFKSIHDQPMESELAELREAQVLATQLPKVSLAITTDCGDELRIHPRRKEPVGARLALAARGIAYNQPIQWSSPFLHDYAIVGDKAFLRFDGIGGGLVSSNGPPTGFAVCGPDRRFVWASDVEILSDNTIRVSSPGITNPIAVANGLTFRALGSVDLSTLSMANLNGKTPTNLGAASYKAPQP